MPNFRKQIEQFGLMMAIRAVIHKHGCIPAGIANQLRFGELEEICYYIEDGNDGAEIKLGAFRYALELAGCFIDMQGLLKFNKLLALDAQLKKLALNKMLDFVDVTETKHQTLTVFEKARITFDEADKFKVMDVAVAAYQKMCKSASSFYQYLSVLENKLASEQTKEEFLKKAIAVAKDYWEWMNVYKLCVPGSDDEKLALKGLDEATVDLGELKEHIYQFPRGRWMDALIRKFLQLKPCFNDVNKLFGIFFHYGMSFYMGVLAKAYIASAQTFEQMETVLGWTSLRPVISDINEYLRKMLAVATTLEHYAWLVNILDKEQDKDIGVVVVAKILQLDLNFESLKETAWNIAKKGIGTEEQRVQMVSKMIEKCVEVPQLSYLLNVVEMCPNNDGLISKAREKAFKLITDFAMAVRIYGESGKASVLASICLEIIERIKPSFGDYMGHFYNERSIEGRRLMVERMTVLAQTAEQLKTVYQLANDANYRDLVAVVLQNIADFAQE